jgi:hypothetical protein
VCLPLRLALAVAAYLLLTRELGLPLSLGAPAHTTPLTCPCRQFMK